ncbi:MAG: hypothetical protein V3T24_03365 [Longimicrobiales bacterium]
MKSSKKEHGKLGKMLRDRCKEQEKTHEELADAAHVPIEYMQDLLAGRRRPPLPARTDIYEPMTTFLRLSRNELADVAAAERKATAPAKPPAPKPTVRIRLLELCEPATAKTLEQRRAKNGNTEMTAFLKRVLDVTQGAVRRVLADQVTLRIAAERSGGTYPAMRLKVLEFLDTTPDTLTMDDLTRFLLPRIRLWDVDLETGVLRVVMHSKTPGERDKRGSSVPRDRGLASSL